MFIHRWRTCVPTANEYVVILCCALRLAEMQNMHQSQVSLHVTRPTQYCGEFHNTFCRVIGCDGIRKSARFVIFFLSVKYQQGTADVWQNSRTVLVSRAQIVTLFGNVLIVLYRDNSPPPTIPNLYSPLPFFSITLALSHSLSSILLHTAFHPLSLNHI